MDDRMTKDELRVWAKCFENAVPESVSFSLDGSAFLTAQQLADRVRPLDATLADKIIAWHTSVTDLGRYVRDRLDSRPRNPLAVSKDLHLARL